MKRPAKCNRIHFSVDGPITMTAKLPRELPRSGDTASATDQEDKQIFLWKCIVSRHGISWSAVESWTEESARRYVEKADLVVVLTENSQIMSNVDSKTIDFFGEEN